jgi:hypothetical protein
VIDAFSVERGRAPNNAMNLVALAQQKLGKIGAVLACNSRDERFFMPYFSLAQAMMR